MTAPRPTQRPQGHASGPPASRPGPGPGHAAGRPSPTGQRPQAHAVGYGGEVITAAMVESRITQLSDDLEALVERLALHAATNAEAEVAYKVKYAKARLVARDAPGGHGPGGRTTNDEADDRALVECESELRAHLIAEAVYASTRDAMFSRGRQLEALRTIAANIRSMT